MNTIRRRFLAVALAATVSVWPLAPAARAQYTNPYTGTTWNNPTSSYLDTVIMGNQQMSNLIIQQSINRSMLERSIARRHGKSKTRRVKRSAARRPATSPAKTAVRSARPAPAAHVAAPVDDAFQDAVQATSFKFTAPSVVPQKLAQLLIPKAADRPKAAQIFGWCLQSARLDFRKNTRANLPADNVARALAYFIVSSHDLALTHNGEKIGQRAPSPTVAQFDALRMQVALALSKDAGFTAKSDRQKQEMYEMLLIMPAYAEVVYGVGLEKHNLEAQELGRGLARDSLKKLLNLKPEKMRFTQAGLQLQ